MGWKDRTGTKYIISKEMDEYLKENGFYEDRLAPRFYNTESLISMVKNLKAPCLRLDTYDSLDEDATLRIFVTAKEIYAEVQTSWGSFDRSYYIPAPDGVNMINIDEFLDIIIDE